MKFIVGGRRIDLTAEEVARAMHGVEPETIREHVVQIRQTVFPPKQVLATVTGWPRQSFTTMEAQRVLAKLGFGCRRAGHFPDRRGAGVGPANDELSPGERLSYLEAGLATAQTAIAGLQARLSALESKRR